jgi:hypothetical protein
MVGLDSVGIGLAKVDLIELDPTKVEIDSEVTGS